MDDLHLEKNLTLEKNGITAVVGSGHYVVTYRGAIFETLKMRYSKFSLGGTSESDILDTPVPRMGYLRLSTANNYTFHMGNTFEIWMQEEIERLYINRENTLVPILKDIKINKIQNRLKNNLFSRIIFSNPFWKMFLRFKGLTKEEANKY